MRRGDVHHDQLHRVGVLQLLVVRGVGQVPAQQAHHGMCAALARVGATAATLAHLRVQARAAVENPVYLC